MKTRTVVLSVVVLVVLAAGGGAWWFFRSLDSLVKSAIERYGPQITGVPVKVASVKIELTEGRGTIRGLVIGNPKGYEAPHAVRIGEISLRLDPASVTKDVVVMKELVLVAPDVVYERGPGGDNLAVIQKNVDAWVAKNSGPKQAGAGPGKKYVIENLYLREGRAHFGATVSTAIPNIYMRDIGKKSNGASAAEVFKQVWGALLRSVSNLAVGAAGMLKGGAKGATEGIKNLLK